MNRYYEIYNEVKKIYYNGKYKEYINAADKYLKLDITNDKQIHNIRFLRAKALRYLGRFDEAIEELKKLRRFKNDNEYSTLELYFIYYYLNRYDEALELLPILYEDKGKYVANHTILITELVMKTQLGMPVWYRKGTRSHYIKEQIVNYSREDALEHIKSHRYEENTYKIHSRFNDDVDIEYLMECAENSISNSEKINQIDVLESHYFSVFGIGYDENNACNYLKVVVCPNTNNIIAMYPFSYIEKENVKVLECDRNKLFKSSGKEKTTLMIDKFNKRFNLK